MSSYPASKARANFSEVLGLAAFGKDRVVIERSGKPVAAVVPIEDYRFLEAFAAEARGDDTAAGLVALRQSEAKYRSIVEEVPDGVLVQRGGIVVFANRAAVGLFHASGPEQLVGNEMLDLIDPDQRELLLERRRALLRENRPMAFSGLRRLRFDGTTFAADSVVAPVIWDGASATLIMIRDQTHQHEAEDSARRTNRRFQDFAEASADWLWETDAECRYTYMSPNVERVVGLPPEWHYGKSRADLIGEDIAPQALADHLQALSDRRPFRDFVYLRVLKGADPRWIRASGVPVFDDDGSFQGYRGSASDITEQKIAEQALRVSEENYALAMDGANECLWSWDLASGEASISPRAVTMFGLPPEELRGHPDVWANYIHPDDRAIRRAALIAHLRGETGHYECEYRVKDTDGSYRWIRDRGASLRDRNGLANRMAGWIGDITERKHAEEQIARLATIPEYNPNPIIETDLDGRARYLNPAAAEHFPDLAEGGAAHPALAGLAAIIASFGDGKHDRIGREVAVGERIYDQQIVSVRQSALIRIYCSDITERKAAERALRESGDRLRNITDNAPIAIFITRRSDGMIQYANPQVERILGLSPDQAVGRCVIDFYQRTEDRAPLMALLDAEGKVRNHELLMRRADGNPVETLHSIQTIIYDGEPATLGGFIDITQRKQTETALRKSEAMLSALVENSPVQIAIKDTGGHYLRLNNQFLEACGLADIDYKGKTAGDLFDQATADAFASHDDEVMRSRATIVRETNVDFPDGSTRDMIAAKFPILDPAGNVIALGYVGTDITERKRTESAFRESEAMLSAMIENSSLFISIKDKDLRYLRINSRYLDAYKLGRPDYGGKTVQELFGEHDVENFVEHDRMVLEAGKEVVWEMTIEFPDGRARTVISTKFPIQDESGEFLGIGFIGTDVTERRAMELQLQQAQKMEAVGQLTGGIAHDFNNLLTVVQGNLELLREDEGDARKRGWIDAADSAARRGAELTERLLAFSRRAPLEPRTIALAELLAGFTELARGVLDESIALVAELPKGLWPLMTDPIQLESALLNLCVNARDELPDGGAVTITAANVGLDGPDLGGAVEAVPGDYVLISVADDGPGMTAEVLEHAIEPFFTTKDVGKGTGLGLSMVYGFVRQSGGQMRIDSAPGKGTTVHLYLPRAEAGAPVAVDRPDADHEMPGHGETILVVEDDAEVRELVIGLMANLGYQTLAAENGADAIAIIEERPDIALLFTDVVLPGGMSGPDIARAAVALRPGLKVVFTSGYAQDALARQTRSGQHVDLLQKPYRKADLARKIAGSLNS